MARIQLLVLFLCSVSFPSRLFVAAVRRTPANSITVQGVVYCKMCQLPGYVKSLDASPLPGAVAQLRCNNGGRKNAALLIAATTDVRGYFKIQTTKVTSAMARNCRLFLVSSPFQGCSIPVYADGEGAATGFPLKFETNAAAGGAAAKAIFAAGFFEFAPVDIASCPHHP
ncbi:pistil-specific extensin-like protein [Ananas comosus]|uniref:Pistil-specific extensin-like protein n=2 Tax=Ananas comosus TaxID=4615 RepID=A0A6P5FAJ6_ANACO|nr:pistil-specific extensin-like protein [Ananas comosus]